jgi:hypothetical protein
MGSITVAYVWVCLVDMETSAQALWKHDNTSKYNLAV